MDIKVVEETPQTETAPTGSSYYPTGFDEIEVAKMLNVEQNSVGRERQKIQAIVDYIKDRTDDHSLDNIKWAIRDLDMKLGSPNLYDRKIDHIYRYVSLSRQKDDIEKKLSKFNPYERE